MRILQAVCLLLLGVGRARAAETPPEAGNYAIASGHVLAVADWEVDPGSPHVLLFTDFGTGRIGVLQKAGDDWVLPARLMSGDEVARLHFVRDSRSVVALSWIESGRAARRAERVSIHTREIHFSSGEATLAGTLWLPPGKGPFPAIVIVPAGALGRAAAAPFTHFFLSEGFAVLAYDRRATRAPFPIYADDAIAAAETVSRQPEVDVRRVGLWGHSQGAWLSVIAAAHSRAIAFVIDHSGMMVPAWQQELYRLAAEATADSTPLETVQEAVAFETRLMRVAASGDGWADVAARLAATPAPAWRALVYQPASLAELQQVWRDDFSFDPRLQVAGVRQPVLALFGGLDRSTPIESAAELVRAIGPAARVHVAFFPTADHAFLDARTGGNAEIPSLSRFVPGMFDTMRDWLRHEVSMGR